MCIKIYFFRKKKSQSEKFVFCTFIIRKAKVLFKHTFGLGKTQSIARHAGFVQPDLHFLKTLFSQHLVLLFVLKVTVQGLERCVLHIDEAQ